MPTIQGLPRRSPSSRESPPADDGMLHPAQSEQVGRPFDEIALGYAAQVDADAVLPETHGPGRLVQIDEPVVD